jgi:hypothetical protein
LSAVGHENRNLVDQSSLGPPERVPPTIVTAIFQFCELTNRYLQKSGRAAAQPGRSGKNAVRPGRERHFRIKAHKWGAEENRSKTQ